MSSQQSGLVAGNQQNEAGGTVPKSRSRFPLSKSFFCTERFADYTPCFVMEGVSGDRITLNQPHQVRTYTLKAPLMQDLLKKKDYFMVPMQAILPLNWEKFYTNPPIGDDVPDGVGCGVLNFWPRLRAVFTSDWSVLATYPSLTGSSAQGLFERLIKFMIFYEMFFSSGSLLKYLHNSGDGYLGGYDGSSTRFIRFDDFFESMVSELKDKLTQFNVYLNGVLYNVYLDELTYDDNVEDYSGVSNRLNLRQFFELVREDLPTFQVGNLYYKSAITEAIFLSDFDGVFSDFSWNLPTATDAQNGGVPLNIARLWAYQLCVAHYYSNDHIDVVYSAELYRQYIRNLFLTHFTTPTVGGVVNSFTINGMKYEYDALSAYTFNRLFCSSPTSSASISFNTAFISCFTLTASQLAYFCSLFGFKRSLRFMDYFTGSRSRPLAVGNETTIDTSGSNVSVLDVTRKFQYTRFYQAINRSGRKFSAYMKELFGKVPAPDYHNPFYLAHTSDVVGASETDNTGVDQLNAQSSITSILRSSAARYAFTFEPDRDCIIIGISYYDLPRVYLRATERQWFDTSRFDMFNPFLQYLGDQPIYRAELGVGDHSLLPFSYTNRDMQYKQQFNQAAGGFASLSTQLKDWFFPADILKRTLTQNIGSTFIRSFSSEFDRFYVRLTGYSLANYFHFIVRYDDRCDASRPMAYAPGILQ